VIQVAQIRAKLRATQRAHPSMRKRVAQELSPEMGRMGAEDPPHPPQQPARPERDMTQRLWDALTEVQDPEMPVNLVDLGLIYGITEHDGVVEVELTFTAMGCPASEFILEDVRDRLLRETGVSEVRVKVVWDPPWTAARMTEAGRDALESWGLAV
jgi:metal-sulfur cluster biosynthetic enzyme